MSINGKLYDWEDIHVVTLRGEQIGITEIKYTDGQSIEARYGRGAVPRGWGPATTKRPAPWCLTVTNGRI